MSEARETVPGMTTSEHHDVRRSSARTFYDALEFSETWEAVVSGGRKPRWLGELISSVVLGTQEEIRYVTLGVDEEAGHLLAHAFTDRYVATATVSGAARNQEHADWTVRVLALSKLRSFDVRATVPPFDPDVSGPEWPGSPSAVLYFENGAEVRIPLRSPWNSRDREPLVSTILRLPAFLV